MMIKKVCAVFLTSALCCTSFAAENITENITKNVETIENHLKQHYPLLKIDNVKRTEVQGIYSASMDGQIIYVSEDAEHVMLGPMLRLKDQKNLTKELAMKQNPVDWASLPLQDAIKTVRGTGKRQLAVFSDPNCPYCKHLEEDLKKLTDVTIYTFIFPIKPQSVAVSKNVWCSENRAYVWQNLMEKGQQPKKKSCDHPIDRNLALGKKLGLNGTPALIFSNGWKVMGAVSANEMEIIFKQIETK